MRPTPFRASFRLPGQKRGILCSVVGTDMMEHDDLNWVVELRRRLHSYPEPSGHEVKTAQKVAEVLKSLDCRVITGVAGPISPSTKSAFKPVLDSGWLWRRLKIICP